MIEIYQSEYLLDCGGLRSGEIVNRRAPSISKGLTNSELGREAIWMKVGTKVDIFQSIILIEFRGETIKLVLPSLLGYDRKTNRRF